MRKWVFGGSEKSETGDWGPIYAIPDLKLNPLSHRSFTSISVIAVVTA